jgi:hypothetical protein
VPVEQEPVLPALSETLKVYLPAAFTVWSAGLPVQLEPPVSAQAAEALVMLLLLSKEAVQVGFTCSILAVQIGLLPELSEPSVAEALHGAPFRSEVCV